MAKVLIVDDEKSIRTTLAEFVREDGHDVSTASTAVEALQLVQTDPPDVIVTDIILPRMSGVDLLSRVHRDHPDVQVIMITGEPTVETASEAVRQGAFDYLSKPVSSSAIRSAVARSARVKDLADDRRRLEEENLRYREHLEEEVDRRGRALRESEERHRAVVENAVEGIVVVQDGLIRFANPSAVALFGYPHDVILRTPFLRAIHLGDQPTIEDRNVQRLAGVDAPEVYSFRFTRADGESRWVQLRPVRFEWDGRPATLNFLRDVTDERRASELTGQRRLRAEALNAATIALAVNPVLYHDDLNTALRLVAQVAADQLDVERVSVWLFDERRGYSGCEELYERGRNAHSRGIEPVLREHPRYTAAISAERVIAAADARRDPRTSEYTSVYFDPLGIGALMDAGIRREGGLVGILSCEHVGGVRSWTDEEVAFAASVAGVLSLVLEADERRRAETALEHREMEYRGLFEDSPVSLFVEDFSGVRHAFDDLRAKGVTDLGTYLDDHPDVMEAALRSIRVLDANDAAIRLHQAVSKDELLRRLTVRFSASSLAFFRDRLLAIWRGERMFESTSDDRAFDGRPLHVALRWSIPPGQEESLDRVLLSKTDITALVEGERRVRRALDGAIEAIGRVTEARDPYTAGHQRRVTELSVALARKLGLEEVRVEATRAAGLLHDIGKLSIPAEILSKPSVLSSLELSLMKTHPQSAYDVLKTIDFPWPVAEIVLQHHERIDGSGYPLGVKGDDILLEARILSVADVVEAMSSHRPYRAALGIEAALEEIERGRGTYYDSSVVDACLHLIRVEGFAFSAT